MVGGALPAGYFGGIAAQGVCAMVVAGMVVALAVLQPRLPSLHICCAATGVVCLYCFNLHGVLALFFVYCIVLLSWLYS